MKNKIINAVLGLVLLLFMCLMLFAVCNNAPRTLYQSESVQVVRSGKIMLISDILADKEYSFRAVRIKRTEGVLEPRTAIDTDTLKIEIIPSGLRVHDKMENKIYTHQRKFLHNKGGTQ